MGLAARNLAAAEPLPVSGVGTATAGSVLTLTAHALGEPWQNYFGIWVYPPGNPLDEYFLELRAKASYAFSGSPGKLAEIVEETLRQSGLVDRACSAVSVTAVNPDDLGVWYRIFPPQLRQPVLDALAPYNVLRPVPVAQDP